MPPARKPEFACHEVEGIAIARATLHEAVEATLAWAGDAADPGGYVSFTGAHGIVEASRDPDLRRALAGARANFADGMPVVWRARRDESDPSRPGRVFGPDFMEAFLRGSAPDRTPNIRHFFCGGGEGLAEQLADRVRSTMAGLEIAGTFSPPFRPLDAAERHQLIAAIEASGADVVWIGLSTPKQEKLMADLSPDLPGRLLFGVGAAFDVHAGLARCAPPALQDLGLEWAWRLAREPRRLLPRYLRVVPAYLWSWWRDA